MFYFFKAFLLSILTGYGASQLKFSSHLTLVVFSVIVLSVTFRFYVVLSDLVIIFSSGWINVFSF